MEQKRILAIWLRLPELDPETKRNILISVARTAYYFSPIVSADKHPIKEERTKIDERFTGFNLDVSGCKRLWGDENELLRALSTRLTTLGIHSRLAIAPTLGYAWALSRYGDSRTIIVGQEGDALVSPLIPAPYLAKLSIEALRLTKKSVLALNEINIRLIGELNLISPSMLLARFPGEVVTRVEQAYGRQEELLRPLRFMRLPKAEIIFDAPCENKQTLSLALKNLTAELCQKLNSLSLASSQIRFTVETTDKKPLTKELPLSAPATDEAHIFSLLDLHLERLQIGTGVSSMSLTAVQNSETLPEVVVPQTLATNASSPHTSRRFAALVDLLTEHLGAARICSMKLHESHIPEKSFSYLPLQEGIRREGKQLNGISILQTINQPTKDESPLPRAERPSFLFYHPLPVRVVAGVPDDAPSLLEWKQKRYRIIRADGPERIAPEWWGRDAELCKSRDYFRVQLNSGSWLWVFRELDTTRWFVHGIWA